MNRQDLVEAGVHASAALRFAREGAFDRAFDTACRAAMLSHGSWRLLSELVETLYARGRLQDAGRVLDYARRVGLACEGDEGPGPLHAEGCIALSLGRPEEALPLLLRASALSPDSAQILANTAVALSDLGRAREAADALARARQACPVDLRIERLALFSSAGEGTLGWLPALGEPAHGEVGLLAPIGLASSGGGSPFLLGAERDRAWEICAESCGELPGRGSRVLAALWNDAGLFLRSGVVVRSEDARAWIEGPSARRIQRRRHFRILAMEDLVRGEELFRDGLRPRDLRDLSACGFSFYSDGQDAPPPVGSKVAFRFTFRNGPDGAIEVPGVVRRLREAPAQAYACVELLSDERTEDRIARILHEHQRRRRSLFRS